MRAASSQISPPSTSDLAARLLAVSSFPPELGAPLREILQTAAKASQDGLRALFGAEVSLSLGEVVNEAPPRAEGAGFRVVARFEAFGGRDRAEIEFDRTALWCLTDVAFGGDGSEPPAAEAPPCSPTELRIGRLAVDSIAAALEASLAPVAAPQFRFEALEETSGEGARAPAVEAALDLRTFGREGRIFVRLPHWGLVPVKHKFRAARTEAPARRDPNWGDRFENEIKRAAVPVRALLEEQMTLGVLAKLKVGQILPLQATPAARVLMESQGQQLFWCELGQADGAYTVRISDIVDRKERSGDAHLPR